MHALSVWNFVHWFHFPINNDSTQTLLKLLSTESMRPSNHLILCHPLLFLPSIFLSIRVFSNESALRIRCSKNWSFSFSVSLSNEYSGLISFRIDWFDFLAVQGLSRIFSNTTAQKHQFFSAQPSLWFNSHILVYRIPYQSDSLLFFFFLILAYQFIKNKFFKKL